MILETQGILIGAAAILFAGLLTYIASQLGRLWHTPKRLDRLEKIVPVMVRALLAILRCQKAGVCNGETDASIHEIESFLSDGIVSQKANP